MENGVIDKTDDVRVVVGVRAVVAPHPQDDVLFAGAVAAERPGCPMLAEVREEVLVLHDDVPACEIEGLDVDLLVHLLQLAQLGIGRAVGFHNAVDDKVAVIGHVDEVAAVGEVGVGRRALDAIRHRAADALVHPVSDEAALEQAVRLEGVPVLLEVAQAVAHRVGVLDVPVRVFVVPVGVLDHLGDRLVGGAVGVGVLGVGVAVYCEARGVALLGPVVQLLEGGSFAGLISQRPDHHGGVFL